MMPYVEINPQLSFQISFRVPNSWWSC